MTWRELGDLRFVHRVDFGGETWLHFPNIQPDVCILRATTADEWGNLTYEQASFEALPDHLRDMDLVFAVEALGYARDLDSVARAVDVYPDPDVIVERNIQTLDRIGVEGWHRRLRGDDLS